MMKANWFLTFSWMALVAAAACADDIAEQEIAPWQPGTLDIHQISSGRGNAAVYLFPDGTTMLVDAGELPSKTPRHTPDRPDSSRRAGEWIVRYVQHALRHDPQPALDYVLLTHFHEDHMGGPADDAPAAPAGAYRLTGVTRVAESLPIGRTAHPNPDRTTRAMAREADHAHIVTEILPAKLGADSGGLSDFKELGLELQIAEAVPALRALSRQRIEIARRSELHRF